MILGHLAFSYLLIKLVEGVGGSLLPVEMAAILIAGSVIDLDIIVAVFLKRGVSHHRFFTHTPLGVFLLWLLFLALSGGYFTWAVSLLVLIAVGSHLILDSIGSWFVGPIPNLEIYGQINWFYPAKRQRPLITISKNIRRISRNFLKADANSKNIELLLLAAAVIVLGWSFWFV